MKNIVKLLCILFLAGCVEENKESSEDTSISYSGSNWRKYEDHSVDIVVLDTSISRSHSILKERTVIKNGSFQISDTISRIRNAFITLYDPKGEYKYKQDFILEPGELLFDFQKGSAKSKVVGGKYNSLINGFKYSDDYLIKKNAYESFRATITEENFKIDSIKQRFNDLATLLQEFEKQRYNETFNNSMDPVTKLLVLGKLEYSYEAESRLDVFEKQFGSDHPEVYLLRRSYKNRREREAISKTVDVGTTIKDFTSNNLEGKEFKLSEVLSKNDYVLVEFWASWCGPCRAEIPHMKKAYQIYNPKGFEIVSFTLDHKMERWEKASTEEQLPWINVGDLKAHKSPVVKMYAVQGIPANFLVDRSGTIIAKDLRQEKLDEKLAELIH
ncbi:MAG: TlpA disulfide reductase family protein [Bacteroidota bacterium]